MSNATKTDSHYDVIEKLTIVKLSKIDQLEYLACRFIHCMKSTFSKNQVGLFASFSIGIIPYWIGFMLCAFIFLPLEIMAQENLSTYKRFRIKPSGSENYINTLLKDSKGFLWLGTNNGLFRFDGRDNDEIHITTEVKTSTQVNELAIFNNTLFVATENGVVQINLNSYKNETTPNISTINEPIISIVADPIMGVWWLSKSGFLYKWKNGIIQKIKLRLGLLHRKESLLFYEGNLWVTTQNMGTYIIDSSSMKTIAHITFPLLQSEDWSIRKTENDSLFLVSSIGLFQVTKNKTGFEIKHLTDGNFFETFSVKNLKFSVLNENKFVYHYEANNIRKNITINIGAEKPEKINKIIFDKEKIFIATTDGFSILDFKKTLFENIHSTYDKINNSFEVPRGILETKNEYILSTYKGIYTYDKQNLLLNRFHKNQFTYALIKEHENIWMVSDGTGLKKWNTKTNEITIQLSNNIKEHANIKSIELLNENTLLLGTDANLFQYNIKTGDCKAIDVQHNSWKKDKVNIYQIKSVNNHQFYIATAFGVLLTDQEGKLYADYGKNLPSTLDKQTYSIWVLNDHTFWAGTGNGMYHFSEQGKVINHLTTKSGLTGNRVASMTPDNNNHLWVATFTGLSAINLKTLEIKNFTKEEGLPDNEFNHSSSLLTSSGDMILGTMNGFIKFDPKKNAQKTSAVPSLNISKIEVGNSKEEKKILNVAGQINNPILVEKKFNYVRIQLFLDPLDIMQKTIYEYKVVGIHPEWIRMGNSPIIYLDNYKKGKYDLQIRAITGQGSRNIITKSISVVVDEYFYKTSWFYVVIFISFFVMILLYLFLYIRRNKNITAVRQHIAQDLHDEVGGYLTGINMNIQLMQQKKGKEEEQIQTIQTLGQKALMSLRDSLWSLDIKSDNGLQFWDRIKTLAAESYGPLDIPYRINQISEMEKIHLNMLEKNYLLYVIKECITNSLKYGDKKQVELRWELLNNFHQITFSNGIGEIHSSSQHGQGKYNIETRLKKIGGEVKFIKTDKQYIVELKLNFLK